MRYRTVVPGVLVVLAFAALAMLGRESSGAVVAKAAYGAQYQYPHDFVAGTGKRINFAGEPVETHVEAQLNPRNGATGTYWVKRETAEGTLTIRGRVTCLTVVGNRAAAKGPVEESNSPDSPVGSQFQVQVTDNGPPGDVHDTNVNFFGFPPEDTGCLILPFEGTPVTQGNFVVHDAG
jgi:hypothetical protein